MSYSTSRARTRTTKSLIFAVLVAMASMLIGAASAQAGGGGVGVGGSSSGGGKTSGSCPSKRFGSRTLSKGDCGDDVKTLNWILKAKASRSVALARSYKGTTASAVRSFERKKNQSVNGVVEKATRKALVGSMSRGTATWYGPTLYGNGVACGGKLHRKTIGVAHKSLPCGTKVVVGYKGRYVRTRVIDRGPYGTHAQWDLTEATAAKLHFKSVGIGKIKLAKIK